MHRPTRLQLTSAHPILLAAALRVLVKAASTWVDSVVPCQARRHCSHSALRGLAYVLLFFGRHHDFTSTSPREFRYYDFSRGSRILVETPISSRPVWSERHVLSQPIIISSEGPNALRQLCPTKRGPYRRRVSRPRWKTCPWPISTPKRSRSAIRSRICNVRTKNYKRTRTINREEMPSVWKPFEIGRAHV